MTELQCEVYLTVCGFHWFSGILSVVWVRHGPLAALIDAHRWRSHTKFWFQIIDGDACAMCVRVYVVRVWLMADGDAIMIYQVSRLVRQRQRLAAMWLRNSLDARNEMKKKHRLFSCSTNETVQHSIFGRHSQSNLIYIYILATPSILSNHHSNQNHIYYWKSIIIFFFYFAATFSVVVTW